MRIQKLTILNTYMWLMGFAGLFILLLYNFLPSFPAYALKDILTGTILIFTLILFFNSFPYRFIFFIIPVFLVSILGIIMSDKNFFLIFASLRQFFMPFIFMVLGYIYLNNQDKVFRAQKTFINITILLATFGFFEYFTNLWLYIDVSSFYDDKSVPLTSYGYPYFWIEPIFANTIFFDNGIPRMVSAILDPINLGNIFVLSLTILIFERNIYPKIYRILLVTFISFALILTFSKGALLQFFIMAILLNKHIKLIYKSLLMIVPIYLIFQYVINHPGFLIHFLGFVEVFNHLSFLGFGFGSFGNYSALYSDSSSFEYVQNVGDSYWSAVIGQLGLIGFLVWFFVFFKACSKISFDHYISKLLLVQIFISALSENIFNFMSVLFLLIFVGGFLRISKRKNLL